MWLIPALTFIIFFNFIAEGKWKANVYKWTTSENYWAIGADLFFAFTKAVEFGYKRYVYVK